MTERAGRADTSADEVILVDANDVATGTMGKLEAHRLGRRHRALSVIIRDSSGRLLLQRRAETKYHSGGLWTNTCCSHPRPGEGIVDAAARRLTEEMGIACPLTFLFSTHYRAAVSNGLIEDEIVHVFRGRFDGTPVPDPAEASAWRWEHPREVERQLANRPQDYTVWFQQFRREFWAELTELTTRPATEW
ncbi:MAG TPA: isopentenyl-diphosphate Delta-isomerase [Xanthobacteraceae bacterium]|nr:isopentenyl-diphosphate Delta-isomerase [Xanthobacteraceae bacterium]